MAVTAPETLTVADGDAQNPRVDSVVHARLRRVVRLLGHHPRRGARTDQGRPAPTPTEPTRPSACLCLWSITVPAEVSAGTGSITWTSALADRRRYTASCGGIIRRGWGIDFTGAYDEQYRDVDCVLERWNAST